jgi:hypothetical protein
MSITKEELVQTILVSTALFQERFDKDSKPDVMKRYEILQSEVEETLKAIAENDLIEILDGYCDQMYVIGGSVDKFKDDNNLKESYLNQLKNCLNHALLYFSLECILDAFNDIHISNMSKVHLSFFHVQETFMRYKLEVKDWRIKQISETEILVYDNSINKLLKPSNYKKANLKPILQKYGYC